jgi:hypothetical protein
MHVERREGLSVSRAEQSAIMHPISIITTIYIPGFYLIYCRMQPDDSQDLHSKSISKGGVSAAKPRTERL